MKGITGAGKRWSLHKRLNESSTNSSNMDQNEQSSSRIEESKFLQQCIDLIPAEVRMISGCADEQTSADVSNVTSKCNGLPDPAGRAGGACTSALLDVLYSAHRQEAFQIQQHGNTTAHSNSKFNHVVEGTVVHIDNKRFGNSTSQTSTGRVQTVSRSTSIPIVTGSFTNTAAVGTSTNTPVVSGVRCNTDASIFSPPNTNKHNCNQLSFQSVLLRLRDRLASDGFTQIPQLSGSRPLELSETPFTLSSSSPSGTRRALLVGINYRGQSGELSGCHNDVINVQKYLIRMQGFSLQNIQILMDNYNRNNTMNSLPTRQNIIAALKRLVHDSQPGDSVFFHYSGHGGLLLPQYNPFKKNCNKNSGTNTFYDETLIPLDHESNGQIRDFNLFEHFVKPMAAGVVVTCVMDCCHSGSVLDLPYSFRAEPGLSEFSSRNMMSMSPSMDLLGNLAFLHIMSGGVLDHHLFGNVENHINDNLEDGTNLEDYLGVMADDLEIDDYGDLDASDMPNDDNLIENDWNQNDADNIANDEFEGDWNPGDAGEYVERQGISEPYDISSDVMPDSMAAVPDQLPFDSYNEARGDFGGLDESYQSTDTFFNMNDILPNFDDDTDNLEFGACCNIFGAFFSDD